MPSKHNPNVVPKALKRYRDFLHHSLDEVQKERIWHGIEVRLKEAERPTRKRLWYWPAVTGVSALLIAATSVWSAQNDAHSPATMTTSTSQHQSLLPKPTTSNNTLINGFAPATTLPARAKTQIGPFGKPTLTPVSLRHIQTIGSNAGVEPSFVAPDGAFLSFLENGQDGMGTYIEDMQGNVAKVTNGLFAIYASTPDGNLVFGRVAGDHAVSFVYQPQAGIIKIFSAGEVGRGYTTSASESTSGHWATITSNTSTLSNGNLNSLAIDGKTLGPANPLLVVWSPTGKQLAVISGVATKSTKLSIINVDTQEVASIDGTFSLPVVQLGHAPVAGNDGNSALDWSADGRYLGIVSNKQILIYDVKGTAEFSAPYVLPEDTSNWGFAGPNELYAMMRTQSGHTEIHFYRIENGQLVQAKHWSLAGNVVAKRTLMDGRVIVQTDQNAFDVVTATDIATIPCRPALWWYNAEDGAIYYIRADAVGSTAHDVWRIELAPVVIVGGHPFQ